MNQSSISIARIIWKQLALSAWYALLTDNDKSSLTFFCQSVAKEKAAKANINNEESDISIAEIDGNEAES